MRFLKNWLWVWELDLERKRKMNCMNFMSRRESWLRTWLSDSVCDSCHFMCTWEWVKSLDLQCGGFVFNVKTFLNERFPEMMNFAVEIHTAFWSVWNQSHGRYVNFELSLTEELLGTHSYTDGKKHSSKKAQVYRAFPSAGLECHLIFSILQIFSLEPWSHILKRIMLKVEENF